MTKSIFTATFVCLLTISAWADGNSTIGSSNLQISDSEQMIRLVNVTHSAVAGLFGDFDSIGGPYALKVVNPIVAPAGERVVARFGGGICQLYLRSTTTYDRTVSGNLNLVGGKKGLVNAAFNMSVVTSNGSSLDLTCDRNMTVGSLNQ